MQVNRTQKLISVGETEYDSDIFVHCINKFMHRCTVYLLNPGSNDRRQTK